MSSKLFRFPKFPVPSNLNWMFRLVFQLLSLKGSKFIVIRLSRTDYLSEIAVSSNKRINYFIVKITSLLFSADINGKVILMASYLFNQRTDYLMRPTHSPNSSIANVQRWIAWYYKRFKAFRRRVRHPAYCFVSY